MLLSNKPFEDPEAKSLISYIPWTKAELWGIVKDFPKVNKHPHTFAEELNIAIQTYKPGFSNLYHLVHLLISEGQAQHWVKIVDWENLKTRSGLQIILWNNLLSYYVIRFRNLLSNFTK